MKTTKNGVYSQKQFPDILTWAEMADISQSDSVGLANPFIEAQPIPLPAREIENLFTVHPQFDPTFRYLPSNVRFELLEKLALFFQPLDRHIELYHFLYQTIRDGYAAHRMLGPGYSPHSYQDPIYGQWDHLVSSMRGLIFTGMPYLGKTVTLERILRSFIQVPWHQEDRSQALARAQVSWLKLDWPYDSSDKSFCLSFFTMLDHILNSTYFTNLGGKGRISGAKMKIAVGFLCNFLNLGLLVIDHIPPLDWTKNSKANELLKFIVSLSSIIRTPVVLVSVDKAYNNFPAALRDFQPNKERARIIWSCLEKDGRDWNTVINQIWQYQYVHRPTILTEELNTAMYGATKGLIGLMINTFILAQRRAIETGLETFTPELIYTIADNGWGLANHSAD